MVERLSKVLVCLCVVGLVNVAGASMVDPGQIVVTVSSGHASARAAIDGSGMAVDENGVAYHESWGTEGFWCAGPDPESGPEDGAWYHVDLGDVYTDVTMRLWNNSYLMYPEHVDRGIYQADIQAKVGWGDSFTTVYDDLAITQAQPVQYGDLARNYTYQDILISGDVRYVLISDMWAGELWHPSDRWGLYGDLAVAEFQFFPAPEPTTMMILGLGAVLLRRKRA